MAKSSQPRGSTDDTVPGTLPDTPTPRYAQAGHDFTLQAIMEMQRTLGTLENKIDNLDRHVGDIAKDVSKHGKWIYAATIVALLALGGFGFVAKVLWDVAKMKLQILN